MKLLIVEDEHYVRDALRDTLSRLKPHWNVAEADHGRYALAALHREKFDLVITDIRMPVMDGLELAKYIAQFFPETRVIILTGYKDFEYAQQALRYNVVDFLLKPAAYELILEAVGKVEEQWIQATHHDQIRSLRTKHVLEKLLQDALYGITIPHFDEELIPSCERIRLFTCSFAKEDLPSYWTEGSMLAALKNVSEEWFLPYGSTVAVIEDHQLVVFVFGKDERLASAEHATVAADSFRKKAKELFKLRLRIGISTSLPTLALVHHHYRNHFDDANDMMRLQTEEVFFDEQLMASLKGTEGGTHGGIERRKNRRVVTMAQQMVKERINQELSLKVIADELFLNPTYLSKIFKNDVGETFSQYVLRIRMEKAKELLQDVKLLVYEVSERVGYKDPAYFSQMFKKWTGQTPADFQKNG